MTNRCFVPNCKNTIGAPFPRDQKVKNQWLEALKITKTVPKLGDFVCFDHFQPSDLNDETSAGEHSLHF